jgi:hypothetical protein
MSHTRCRLWSALRSCICGSRTRPGAAFDRCCGALQASCLSSCLQVRVAPHYESVMERCACVEVAVGPEMALNRTGRTVSLRCLCALDAANSEDVDAVLWPRRAHLLTVEESVFLERLAPSTRTAAAILQSMWGGLARGGVLLLSSDTLHTPLWREANTSLASLASQWLEDADICVLASPWESQCELLTARAEDSALRAAVHEQVHALLASRPRSSVALVRKRGSALASFSGVFVINLLHRAERWGAMRARAAAAGLVGVQRFDAVYGKALNTSEERVQRLFNATKDFEHGVYGSGSAPHAMNPFRTHEFLPGASRCSCLVLQLTQHYRQACWARR